MTVATKEKPGLRVSEMAETLIGSEIIRLANEINERIGKGEKIHNLTIGDFNPAIFPIPAELREEILKAYSSGQTNYPVPNGMPALRKAISGFLERRQDVRYNENEILVSGGARPLIYAAYQALVDPGDLVVFPVPSWNNNHYTHLLRARQAAVETKPENNFMPVAADLEPWIGEAAIVAVCSPLNPAGTVFGKEALNDICKLIVEENRRRQEAGRKPLYLLYDQIYWALTFGETQHHDPVSLCPEIRDYTVYVDGLSKAFAATGVRVGWAFGPQRIMEKMKSILSHVGAWAPKAEQVASAAYLVQHGAIDSYLAGFKQGVEDRLNGFHSGFMQLKKEGFGVDAVAPQAAIYLTVKIDLKGKKKPGGQVILSQQETTRYILDEARLAIVPFSAFGTAEDSPWYRLSVGTCRMEDVEAVTGSLREAMKRLS